MHLIYLTILFSISASSFALDDFQSPCPGLFVYEAKGKKSDNAWHGIATILSDTDAYGVRLKLIFDKHPLQVGNWYGEILIKNETVYDIANVQDQLKANVPKTVRFFVKYNITEPPPPKLLGFLVNGKKVCPEEKITKTDDGMRTTPRSVNVSLNIERIPLIGQGPPSLEEDDFFMGDIYHFLKPPSTIKESSDDDICGTVLTPPTPLVPYDELKHEGEFPWHVAIYYVKGIDPIYICGGSLISKNFVITVAHCVAKLRSSTHLNPEKLIVYLGKHYLKRFSNEEVQERLISQIILHPQYNAYNYSNDIALLKLLLPVEYNNYVRPVCLWRESTDLNKIFKKEGNVVGWGFDDTGKVTEELMKTDMLAVSQEICIASFPEFYDRFVSQKTYCAGFRNGTSVCNGDSGSGMVFPKSTSTPKNQIWQLRGLVSLSAALHNHLKCDPSKYVVFTDVAQYLDWINNIIK